MDISFIILSAICILFLLMGFSIKYLKFYFLIAGFNKQKKENRKFIDIEGISKFIGNYFFIAGAAAFISLIFVYLESDWILEIFIGFIILTLPYLLWKAQKYDKRVTNYKDYKIVYIVVTVIFAVFYVLVMSLLLYASQEQQISLSTDCISINSPYSERIYYKDIIEIKLKNSLPEIKSKKNGFDGINHIDKGYFILDGIGEAKLYIHKNAYPYIFITTKNNHYIINYKNPVRTKALYKKIAAKLSF